MSVDTIGEAFFIGCCFGAFGTGFIGWFACFPGLSKYEELVRETKYLANSKNGIVTVTDLVFKAQISPTKAKKFLKKLAQQLEAEVEIDRTGAICYRFISSETMKYRQEEYENLIYHTKTIAKYNKGIVTVTDLAFEAKVSPDRARNFLEELAQQLQADIYSEKTADGYYKFISAENIDSKLLQ